MKPIRPSSFEMVPWRNCWIASPHVEPYRSTSADKRRKPCSDQVQIVSLAVAWPDVAVAVAVAVAAAHRMGLAWGRSQRLLLTGSCRYI